MAVVPVLPPISTGLLSSSTESALATAISFLLNSPRAKLRQTVAQTLTTSVGAAVTFDAEDFDKNPAGVAQHDNVTNNSRFTAAYAGLYWAAGNASFAGNATGVRTLSWTVNGSPISGMGADMVANIAGTSSRLVAASGWIPLSVGDYLELIAFQNSGSNLATGVVASEQATMSVWFGGNL